MKENGQLEATHKVYVTALVGKEPFRLLDNPSAEADGYFVCLARKNPVFMGFEYSPRAVYAAGRFDIPGRELIVDAARQLLSPKTVLWYTLFCATCERTDAQRLE